MSEPRPGDTKRDAEEAASAQRRGARKLTLEDRFRQNDSISRFRAEALRSRRT